MRATVSIIALSALFAAGAAQADVIGATFGAGGWSQSPGGDVNYEGDDFDVDDELGLDDETGAYAYAKLEHPVPVLPNVRLHYQQASFEGTGTVTATRRFGDITFSRDEEVKAEANLDYIDGTLYYEVLDNVVSADLGLNIRYMSGDVSVAQTGGAQQSETVDLNVAFPMGYAMLRADIPTTGLFLKAEGAFIGYDGNRIADVMLGGGYELDLMAASIGLEAGYKSLQVKLNDVEDADADVSVQGPYAGVVVDF